MRKALFTAALAMASGMALFSTPAAACNDEAYIGTVCTFAFDWCPRNYIPADGRTLAVREYQALFSLVGYRYGGNNADIFGIPDLRGRAAIGSGTGPGLANIAIGAKVGQQELLLSAAQVPLQPHTHTATFTGTGGGSGGSTTVPFTGTVSVPVTNGGTPVSAPASGTVYLGDASINDGGLGVSLTGPYNTTGPGTGAKVAGTASGSITVPNTGITGGTVAVAPASAGATQKVSTQSPAIGQTVCIVANGLYPNRP
ncbi:phage tail protein [Azospirillum baldaniorum]|uniref:phage tail protein n=1 Tax=Azospirillum baldaniorum TaxID=1064539 RepID=UPI000D5FF2E5|nr:phage tail protein [Azospirillum baldaniorum]AWJ90290.1 phage tail protein [Azospirillum baldaniorum]TWA77152.1 microcystin-dependent protein [Azospirillum brasilense]